ncbi:MAG TPA: cytochrome P450 [Steroidobacter sp.]|uniref:cytochrome P450 n=1 Tax=Steroidobacter sp. TaxID=1978227 RepID=UPI002EDB58B8
MDDLNFFDLDMFSRGFPHQAFRGLRRDRPISWHALAPPHSDQGFWLATKHKDICEIARQSRIFISHAGSVLADAVQIPHPAWRMIRDGLCHLDAPKHAELRRLVVPQFGAEAVATLETTIRRRAVEVLDRAQARGRFDLVAEIATEFPVRVVYQDVLGFAESDLKTAAYWGDLFNRVHAVPNGDREFSHMMQASGVALERLYRYAVDAFRSRRDAPRDDVLSILAGIRHGNGEPISEQDFLSYFWSLAIGAYDTTAGTIAGGIAALAAHPEQQAKLYANPSLIESAVEEMLRWESPVIYFRRTAAADYELGGQAIKQGDRVVMCFASGNRDEEVFQAPDIFDIERHPNPHLAFGHGAHFCLGARLARLELRVLFEEIVARGLRFELAGPIARARSNFINRITRMPVAVESRDEVCTIAFE